MKHSLEGVVVKTYEKRQTKTMTISVIIPNWNGQMLLAKNLPHVLAAKKNSKNKIVEVIVVDDASTDNSSDYLNKTFKRQIRLIKHKVNRGFAESVNAGARYAKGDLLCLLNTDVVVSNNFLEATIKHFENPVVFSVVLHEMGSGPATGNFLNGYLAHKGLSETKTPTNSLWASGGSSVFRRSSWWDLGGLDAELFKPFYWEDVDLGYRAWKRGMKILWEPNAKVEHKHEGTINPSSFRKKYMDQIKERNELLFLWKNITSKKMFNKHLLSILGRVVTHPGYLKIVVLALKKRKLVLKRREKERKETNVSDEAVFAIFKNT